MNEDPGERRYRAFVLLFCLGLSLLAGLQGLLGPDRYFTSTTLVGLRQSVHIPLRWYAYGFLATFIFLLNYRTRLIGWVLGTVLFSYFGLATLFYTYLGNEVKSPYSSPGALAQGVLFYVGARYAAKHGKKGWW